MEDPYSFDWMALWPLVAVASSRNDVAGAIDYARALLVEHQHPLPEKLAAATQKAIESLEKGEGESVRDDLACAIQIANEGGQI